MSDFINKLITVVLIFILLVMAPMLISYKLDEMVAHREILNDVELFIDRVKDTSTITKNDINSLYMDCNSHGLTVDVRIKRLIQTDVFDTSIGVSQTNYFAVDDEESLKNINAGDIIQVQIEELTTSSAKRATYRILGLDEGPMKFTLAGVVG